MDARDIDEASAGAILTIDLQALAANWRLLRDIVAPAECASVVKADAYGIGLEPTVEALRRAGCKTFFVAQVSEALRVRKIDPGCTLYLLNGLVSGSSALLAQNAIRPVLSSLGEIKDWARFCQEQGARYPAAIQVDTGINRLGIAATEIEAARPFLARSSPRS